MLVRNVPAGHVELPYGYSSWLNYWESVTGRNKEKCGYLACPYEGTIGVIVERKDKKGIYYVMPECYSCSKFPENAYYPASELALVKIMDRSVVKRNENGNYVNDGSDI